MSSSILDHVQRDLDAGRVADGARRLIEAAASGDVAAVAELAHWRILGDILPRDLPAARRLLGQAGRKGDRPSSLLHAYFLAAGVGGGEDWSSAVGALRGLATNDARCAAQLSRLDAMDLDPSGYPKGEATKARLCDAPLVSVSRGLLSDAECDYLRDAGGPALRPSLVIDPGSGRTVPNPIRTSDGMMFGVYDEDLVVNAINRRIARLSDTDFLQGEPLQLLRYSVGQEYRAHMDAIGGEANQRILTVLIYLSDDYDGGETFFPRLGISFRGNKGDALLFRNVDDNDRPNALTLHEGRPVTQGVKLIATRWIRRSRFSYPPPHPLLPEFS